MFNLIKKIVKPFTPTKKNSQVRIFNRSSFNFQGAVIAHLYSDVYIDNLKFTNTINKNSYSPYNSTTVRYNVGTGTTGKDWWRIVVVSDKNEVYMSNPNNFRNIADLVDKYSSLALSIASLKAGNVVGVASILTGFSATGNSTVGFKQHILRESDSNVTIEITDQTVKITTPSGSSETNLIKVN